MFKHFTSFLDNLNIKWVLLIYLGLGLLIYGNSLFNPFIVDDYAQVKDNKAIRSILNIPSLFRQGTFYSQDVTQKGQQNFYKPVLTSAFALIYLFSEDQPFGFHLIQILLHITNAILIYLILKYFFESKLSLFLSLIWFVHPLNTEAVIYISALQEPLFLFFGLSALYIAIKRQMGWYSLSFIGVLLLLSLLSKETGALFLIIIPLFSYLYHKNVMVSWLAIITSGVSFFAYVMLRFAWAQIDIAQNIIVPIQTLSFSERMVNVPKIVFYYLLSFIYPRDLVSFQSWTIKYLTTQDFYIPFMVSTVFLLSATLLGVIIFIAQREIFKSFLFFFVWLILGLGLHLQIIPLDQTVADRWFYFPMIGLLGLIGTLITYLQPKKHLNASFTVTIIIIVIIVLSVLSVRVIIRNVDWNDPLKLYMHDLKYDQENFQLIRFMGDTYHSQQKFSEAENYYLRANNIFPNIGTFFSLGIHYFEIKQYENAEKAFENALKYEPENINLLAYLAVTKYKLGNKEEAILVAKKANKLAPITSTGTLLWVIENNKEEYLQF